MRIKSGFVLRKVADQYVVIATGEASKNFSGMVKLNQVGADIWQGLMDGCEEEEIVKRLTDKYEVDSEKAAADTKALLEKMISSGFVTE